ncbi:DNA polymerase III subunit gamma and tau [Streptacidiphilus monticola]|uniref:DNA-directed DNA polymerase n=1 Tax=Streptacidiphilus monticola TaxID=2161674 RepID=A0ABW1G1H7_9ACTN
MSLALYRRYRPETFAEVIGQEHVTGPLQQALRNNRVNHAYLFSGPRGCGKTTSARILARCLNCEQGPTPTPCGECRSCVDLARGGPGSIDVIEIDAASHGGVDDTRDLREKAFFAPASSRYKIYIIDEAHMVSTAGFNALLKVVEEPPEHLKFIFATTEPEKVIGTIRSRTHHYPFRLVPPATLRDYLTDVCGREQIQVEESVFPLVVRAGGGSVRDSMSVMDQLLAGAGAEGVTYAMATALLGYTDAALLDEIVDAFAEQDGAAVFGIVDRVVDGGHDPRRFVADLLERLRDLVILSAVPDAGEKGLIDAPADRVELMEAQARRFGSAELSRAADLVNTGLTEMRGATSPRLQLELICARVLLPAAFADERSLQARLEKLERRALVGGAPAPMGSDAPGTAAAGAARPHPQSQAPTGGNSASGSGSWPAGSAPATAGPGAAPTAVGGPDASGVGAANAGAWPVGTAAPQTSAAAGGEAAVAGAWPATTGTPGGAPPVGSSAAPGPAAAQAGAGAWPVGTSAGGGVPAAPQAPAGSAPTPTAPTPSAAPTQSQADPGAWPAGATAVAHPAHPAPAPQPAPQAQAAGGAGVVQVRQMWPQILEAVKGRRRVTWMLLQQGQVAGFDGATLQLAFEHAGTRDGFVNGGHDEILRQALQDALGVNWRVECIVGGPGTGAGPAAGTPGSGPQAAPQRPFTPAPAPSAAPAPAPVAPSAAAPATPTAPTVAPPPRTPPPPAVQAPAPSPAPEPVPEPYEPDPYGPEDDYPDFEEDAPLTVPPPQTGVSGQELIVRELNATVIEEITHER